MINLIGPLSDESELAAFFHDLGSSAFLELDDLLELGRDGWVLLDEIIVYFYTC